MHCAPLYPPWCVQLRALAGQGVVDARSVVQSTQNCCQICTQPVLLYVGSCVPWQVKELWTRSPSSSMWTTSNRRRSCQIWWSTSSTGEAGVVQAAASRPESCSLEGRAGGADGNWRHAKTAMSARQSRGQGRPAGLFPLKKTLKSSQLHVTLITYTAHEAFCHCRWDAHMLPGACEPRPPHGYTMLAYEFGPRT